MSQLMGKPARAPCRRRPPPASGGGSPCGPAAAGRAAAAGRGAGVGGCSRPASSTALPSRPGSQPASCAARGEGGHEQRLARKGRQAARRQAASSAGGRPLRALPTSCSRLWCKWEAPEASGAAMRASLSSTRSSRPTFSSVTAAKTAQTPRLLSGAMGEKGFPLLRECRRSAVNWLLSRVACARVQDVWTEMVAWLGARVQSWHWLTRQRSSAAGCAACARPSPPACSAAPGRLIPDPVSGFLYDARASLHWRATPRPLIPSG